MRFRSVAVCRFAAVLTIVSGVLGFGTGEAVGQVSKQVVAKVGDLTPSGNGTYSGFAFEPVLNEVGQVAFRATVSGGNEGIFRRQGSSGTEIARIGGAAPGGGTFTDFLDRPQINDVGQVAFMAGAGQGNVFRGDGLNLVRLGGQLTFARFGFNSAGQASTYTGNVVVRADGPSLTTTIASVGTPTPPSGTTFGVYGKSINDAGQVAYFATLSNAAGAQNEDQALYLGNGTATIEIAREGQLSPSGVGVYDALGDPQVNNAGRTAFFAKLRSPALDWGLFARDANGTSHELARVGQQAPGGGNLAYSNDLSSIFAHNGAGQVAFPALITGGQQGIFISNNGVLIEVTRTDALAPGPLRRISTFPFNSPLALSDKGDVAFIATTARTDASQSVPPDFRESLFFYDASSAKLIEIAREGDSLLGSTIDTLAFAETSALAGDEAGGINNLGQLAYLVTLANEQEVIMLATVPEPSVAAIFIGALTLCFCRRRR